jgi:hypothetical protein
MLRRVIDSNVAIVANGRETNAGPKCRLRAIERLNELLADGQIVVDVAGEMIDEYRRYCEPKGQPGVGDRFFREILMNYEGKIERVHLEKDDEGNFVDFPKDPDLAGFDHDDKKFAAAGRKAQCPVANATDSDWLDYRVPLERNGVEIEFVCGTERADWLEPQTA